MFSLRSTHRWFAMGFVLAWALSHAALANAQNDSKSAEPTPAEKIRKTLDRVIALDYQGNSFTEAINHIKSNVPQLNIAVDQIALAQMGLVDGGGLPLNIEIKNTRGKVRTALSRLLANHNLTYVVLEDCLLITTEENAVNRQMRQRLPVDVSDMTAAKAFREISRQAGINLIIDPRVNKAANQNVNLQLDDASVETALRLVAELVDLKAVRVGNVMFVTDPARAEKIRREESLFPPIGPLGIERVFNVVGGAIGIGGGGPVPVPPPAPDAEQPKAE